MDDINVDVEAKGLDNSEGILQQIPAGEQDNVNKENEPDGHSPEQNDVEFLLCLMKRLN
jgi:hypothetical protein